MVIRIRKKEVLYREITLNTDNIKCDELIDYISKDNVADEEITPGSYYKNEYWLDDEYIELNEQEFYNSMYPINKGMMGYIEAKIEEAYGDRE